MKNSIINFLSVDEQKLSALILCLFALVITSIYMYITSGALDVNMRDVIGIFVTGIAGINVASVFRQSKNDTK